jgi:aspartoacylase
MEMKLVILGGTHGNEFVGIEVIHRLEEFPIENPFHSYQTFLANPKAYQLKKRFVDSDLNRAFGTSGQSKGYEEQRARELQKEIEGNFDFLLDLHTTTSNMGLTVILSHRDERSLKAACLLAKTFPSIKLICERSQGKDAPFTPSMCPSGLTIEVGPVANNVVKAELVLACAQMAQAIICSNFDEVNIDPDLVLYQTTGNQIYPGNEWMVHPELEGHDFDPVKKGTPLFINFQGKIMTYQEEEVFYPFFINEAAYQNDRIAFAMARKTRLKELL